MNRFYNILILGVVMLAMTTGFTADKQNAFDVKKNRRIKAAKSVHQQFPRIQASTNLAQKIKSWAANTPQPRVPARAPVTLATTQRQAWNRIQQQAMGDVTFYWDEKGKHPIFIQARDLMPSSQSVSSPDEKIKAMMQQIKSVFGLENPDDHLQLVRAFTDDLGMQHFRLAQAFANIPVYGKDLYFHFDSYGQLESINGRLQPIKSTIDIKPALSSREAKSIALKSLGLDAGFDAASRLVIYPLDDETQLLTYSIEISPTLAERWELFVDAHTGDVVKKANRICYDGPAAASGQDISGSTRNFGAYEIGGNYFLIDTSKPMFDNAKSKMPDEPAGGIVILDAQNQDGQKLYYVTSATPTSWNSPNAISAIFNGGRVYDYYFNVHGRNSIDGKGGTMFLVVNFNENYNNAFWNGQLMVFGNGDGQEFSDLSEALDVTAHEMTHGVIENTANLIYENQSGALNESFADVFGVATEFHFLADQANWLVGEDVTTPNTPGDGLRDMIEPDGSKVAGGKQPKHMDQFQNLPNTPEGDNGGVHINSGIPNRAFYEVAQAIGMPKAEIIYYRALATYLTRSSKFIDSRIALAKAAADLHGEGSPEQQAILNAYSSVGILDGAASPTPPVQPGVQGQEWLLAVDSSTNGLYRVSTDASVIELLSQYAVLNKPSVTDDGSFVLFVDTSYNPHIVDINGSNEELLDESGIFWNLAVSPDGTKLAAITNQLDGSIYVVDLTGAGDLVQYPLYAQTYTEGEKSSSVLFADALDWTLDSQYIIYDALNAAITANEDTLEFWDINLLRVQDGTIFRMFPPQQQGINIGNPVLASNNDFIMAFDYLDESGNVSVLGVNLETGEIGTITENGQSIGRPDFSPDDQAVVYEYQDGLNFYVYWTPLQPDGITGTGGDQVFLTGAKYPIWLAVGARPTTAVENKTKDQIPGQFDLLQNYPNPFNPSTTIAFHLPKEENITLSVIDITGRTVAELARGRFQSGRHEIQFDGSRIPSGVYFYRLETETSNLSRKMLLLK